MQKENQENRIDYYRREKGLISIPDKKTAAKPRNNPSCAAVFYIFRNTVTVKMFVLSHFFDNFNVSKQGCVVNNYRNVIFVGLNYNALYRLVGVKIFRAVGKGGL